MVKILNFIQIIKLQYEKANTEKKKTQPQNYPKTFPVTAFQLMPKKFDHVLQIFANDPL